MTAGRHLPLLVVVLVLVLALENVIATTSLFFDVTSSPDVRSSDSTTTIPTPEDTTTTFDVSTVSYDASPSVLSSLPSVSLPMTWETATTEMSVTPIMTSYDPSTLQIASSSYDYLTPATGTDWLEANITQTMNETTAEPSQVTFFPSSMMTATSSSSVVIPTGPTTTPKPKTTTPPDPKETYICRGDLPPIGVDSTFEVLVPGQVIAYTCRAGFRRKAGNAFLRCGQVQHWTPKPPLECEALEWEFTKEVSTWPMTLLTVLTVLLGLAVCYLLLLTLVLFCLRGAFSRRVLPWRQTSKPPAYSEGATSRRWPWKRSPRPRYPPGPLGPDGVAWIVDSDTVTHPVKQ